MTDATSTTTSAPRTAEPLVADETLDCKVECTDPGSLPDFRAFARQHGYTLLSAEERDGVQQFHLRKEDAR
jgi:TusA-related sulfurtransferase